MLISIWNNIPVEMWGKVYLFKFEGHLRAVHISRHKQSLGIGQLKYVDFPPRRKIGAENPLIHRVVVLEALLLEIGDHAWHHTRQTRTHPTGPAGEHALHVSTTLPAAQFNHSPEVNSGTISKHR